MAAIALRPLLLARRPTAFVVRRAAGSLIRRPYSNASSKPPVKDVMKDAAKPTAVEPASSSAGTAVTAAAARADPVTSLTAAADREVEEFKSWQAMQKRMKDENEVTHPSLNKVLTTGVVAAAATPAVLLLPTLVPLMFVQSAYLFLADFYESPLYGPFWPLYASVALVGHPSITLTCATTCALAFASQRSVPTAWDGGRIRRCLSTRRPVSAATLASRAP